jgi:hypothetical protein
MDVLQHPPDENALHLSAKSYAWENCAQKYLELLRGG